MNKKGVSQVVSAVLLIIIVIAAAAVFGYIYNNFIFSEAQTIEGTVFEEIGLKDNQAKVSKGCESKWVHGEWSQCKVSYNLEDLIKEEELVATRSRVVQDKNGCSNINVKVETEDCLLGKFVTVKKVEKCNLEYLEVRDEESNLVSRIELKEESETPEMNLELIFGDIEYCSHCYNNEKDEGEDGVDCSNDGISCPTCPSA